MDGHLVEHISRDATAIEAREKPAPKPKAAKPKRRKRGRPRKGEARAKEPSRLERQLTMSLPQMLADLPRACDVGTKRNAKGHPPPAGYKLHVDTADGGIPIGCIMTSASTHEAPGGEVGDPDGRRVENLDDLMTRPMPSRSGRTASCWATSPSTEPPARSKCKRPKQEEGAAHARSRRPRSSLRRALGVRADQWAAQGSSAAAMKPRARVRQGSRPTHVRHDRADGQPADAPYRSLPISGSSPSPSRWPHFSKDGAAKCARSSTKIPNRRLPTLIRPWSRSAPTAVRRRRCYWVFAPLRIDQSFARRLSCLIMTNTEHWRRR